MGRDRARPPALRAAVGDAILVSGGCVCCALRGDLVDALRDALARRDAGALPPFGRIVLETTGLAEPAPILHALFADPELADAARARRRHDGRRRGQRRRDPRARPESARQIALADRLVVAKTDLWPEAERAARFAELDRALRALNPVAPILDGAAGEFSAGGFPRHVRAAAGRAGRPSGRRGRRASR